MESLLISIAGGVTGLLFSVAATKWLVNTWRNLPSAQSIHVRWICVGVCRALVIATALLAGLLPAISSTRKGAIAALQASSRNAAGSQSRTALRKTLLTVEIATTVVLLIGAAFCSGAFGVCGRLMWVA